MTQRGGGEGPKNLELEPLRLEGYRGARTLDDATVDALFARVAATTVDRPASLRDSLRELKTPVRFALSLALALGIGAGVLAAMGVAPSVADAGAGRYVVALGSVVGFMALAVAISLRGAHRRSLGVAAWLLALTSLAAPIALGMVPGIWGGRPAPSPPAVAHDLGLNCFRVGLIAALVTGLAVRLFQREDRPTPWRLVALAAAGGLVAFGTSQLYCPSDNLLHVTVGHGLVGVLLALVVLGAAWLFRHVRRA
jgi:hypothetical protein